MTLVLYVSGHGFGHASRCLELAAAIAAREPRVRIVVRSSVPRWFLDRYARTPLDVLPGDTDTGMVQIDGLTLDEDGTALLAARFYSTFAERVRKEASLLAELGASIVVGDVPPLAFAAAAMAGIPSVAVANFTWDWIYAYYPQFEELAPGVLDVITAGYAKATAALRLPLHGGFDAMPGVVRDIPFIARRAGHSRDAIRSMLDLSPDMPIVLASFGAYGVTMPIEAILESASFTLVLTEHEQRSGAHRRLKRVTTGELAGLGLRYEDLVAAADVVVSKPGYGIISECVANGAALLYTSRDRFIEYDVLVKEMPALLRCRYISQEDFSAGRWNSAIAGLLEQPRPAARPDVNGADIAATAILSMLH